MMYRSATVQANLDFADEADMVKKMRVSLALQPIVTALFANSPFIDGKPSGYLSFRSHIWLDTDRARTGMLPFVFDEDFGFDRYAEHALDVPMYFVIRDHQYIDTSPARVFAPSSRASCRSCRAKSRPSRTGRTTSRRCSPRCGSSSILEMRGADMGDREHVLALPALWVGLLYDDAVLEDAWQLVRDWTNEERQTLRNEVPRSAIHTLFRTGTVADVASDMLALARRGLVNRGLGEEVYLAPLEQTLTLGKTPAERWLDKYHGEWNGDLTRVFDEAEI